ncbi:MAG: SecE/Sec61-gamma subunit of protein translocation complex [Thermoleophilia bacterium]|nr:SecE/Sec61-gamma subunit of protein translocation complex [Thermoleophilia bacterium]MCZ4496807.1 SecE/Sec61-gamma subunit of protein translocation complex [Thermoleophilia bacterium]
MAKAANTGNRSPMPPPSGQRTGARKFVRESWGELKKVQWPTRAQVGAGTLVVAVVTAVIAAYISLVDQGAVRLVDQLNKIL